MFIMHFSTVRGFGLDLWAFYRVGHAMGLGMLFVYGVMHGPIAWVFIVFFSCVGYFGGVEVEAWLLSCYGGPGRPSLSELLSFAEARRERREMGASTKGMDQRLNGVKPSRVLLEAQVPRGVRAAVVSRPQELHRTSL